MNLEMRKCIGKYRKRRKKKLNRYKKLKWEKNRAKGEVGIETKKEYLK